MSDVTVPATTGAGVFFDGRISTRRDARVTLGARTLTSYSPPPRESTDRSNSRYGITRDVAAVRAVVVQTACVDLEPSCAACARFVAERNDRSAHDTGRIGSAPGIAFELARASGAFYRCRESSSLRSVSWAMSR